jgi:hypothetical protein
MGKPKRKLPGNDDHLADDATDETLRRSKRRSRGTGGTLQQLIKIQGAQTSPPKSQNAEVGRIKDALGQQPENPFAPSTLSRKKATEHEASRIPFFIFILLFPEQ